MFVVAPLLLIGLLLWIQRGAPRPLALAVAAAGVAAVLPALIPFERFLQLKVRSDTLMIVPLWNVQDEVGLPRLDDVVLLVGIAAAAAFLLVPRRYALALPALVLAYFALAIHPVHAGPHGMEQAAAGALFEGISRDRDWIDRAVRRRGRRRPLHGPAAPLHRPPERVLQLVRRPRLHEQRADGRRPARDARHGGRGDRRAPPRGRHRRARALRAHRRLRLARRRAGRRGSAARPHRLPHERAPRLDHAGHAASTPTSGRARRSRYERMRCRGGTLERDGGGRSWADRRSRRRWSRLGGSRRVVATVPARELVTMYGPAQAAATASAACASPSRRPRIPGPQDMRELGTHFRAFEYFAP